MQTLTVQVTNQNALKALHTLEEKHFIKIIDDSDLHSAALPGNPLPLNAIKIGDAIFAIFDKIATNPFAYKECEQLSTKTKMYRQASCYSWYIIYKILATEIVILGIIHQSRKPARLKALRKVK